MHAPDQLVAWELRFARWLNLPEGPDSDVRAWASGRASLLALLRALQIGPGQEVLVPAFTCRSVTNAVRYAGAQVRFADIETEGFGLDAQAVRQALTPATRALLLQHSFGLVGRDFEALLQLARERGLLVIEDCAHATGARWQGRPLGTFGDGAVFSFERGKVLSTVHGGMAVVRGEAASRRMRALGAAAQLPPPAELQGLLASVVQDFETLDSGGALCASREPPPPFTPRMWPEEYEGRFCPQYGYRMAPVVAAMADAQFDRLDEVLLARRAQALRWAQWSESEGLRFAQPIEDSSPAWLRFPVWVQASTKRSPRSLEERLQCELGLWFTSPEHPVPSPQPQCPRGMDACARVLNLPTLLPPGHPFAAGSGFSPARTSP